MKLALAALSVAAVVSLPTLASAATSTEVKTAHVAFGSCVASAVTMKVGVAPRVVVGSQELDVIATVTNRGKTSCTYTGGGASPQGIGPCSALTMQVFNAKGQDVWPANVVYHCPVLFGEHLAPGASLTATGSWQQKVNAPKSGLAPRGRYHLIVEKSSRLSFPFTLRRAESSADGGPA